MSRDRFTMYVGNVDERASESLLYELFMQAGPVTSVRIPSFNGKNKNFAFVEFKHESSVPYTVQLMGGMELFGRPLNLQSRGGFHRVEPMPFSPPPSSARRTGPSPRVKSDDFNPRDRSISSFDNARQFLEDANHLKRTAEGKRHRDDSMMPASKSRRKSDSPDRNYLNHIPDTLNFGQKFAYPSVNQSRNPHPRHSSRDNDAFSGRRGEQHHRRNEYRNRHDNEWSRGYQKNRNNSRHNHRKKN